MKRFIITFALCLTVLVASIGQTAVVYSSDDPYSSAAAAVVQQKYSISYLLDVSASGTSTGVQTTWAGTLDSLTSAYILVDTVTVYAADKLRADIYDSIADNMYTGYSLDYLAATTSITRTERVWDSIYPGVNPPLIILYLSESDFTEDKFDASGGTDSTIFKANATGWTDGEFDSGYTAYITAGPGIGSLAAIESTVAVTSGNADTLDFDGTAVFSATITSSSDAVIMSTSQFNRWGFYDVYAYYGVLVKLADISTSTAQDGWDKLLDDNDKLNSLATGRSPNQDRAYLSTILDVGKNVFDYLVEVGN
jgi:hypothetical protein